jgi:hypothetical protein
MLTVAWVVHPHVPLLPRYHLPFTPLVRFAIAGSAALAGVPVAALFRRTADYLLLVLVVVLAPIVLVFKVLAWTVYAPIVLPPQGEKAMRYLQPLRNFCGSFVGKMLTWTSVVVLVWLTVVTPSGAILIAEVLLLVVLLLIFLAGFLHTSANPLMLMEVWQSMQVGSIGKLRRFTLWIASLSKAAPDHNSLVDLAAFATVQMARAQGTATKWRHLWAFLMWLLVAMGTSVLAFAGILGALLQLVPLQGFSLPSGFWSRVSLSISVMGSLNTPEALLYPFSIYTVAVTAELLTAIFFIAVAVIAFTTMAREESEAMQNRIRKTWTAEIERWTDELRKIMPQETFVPRINEAIVEKWLTLRPAGSTAPAPTIALKNTREVQIHTGPAT